MHRIRARDNVPVVSVVTVVFNGIHRIEATMQSVIAQQYPALEYIVIDGGSTDGTPDVIRRYAPRLHYWASAPDCGIYDAMNTGVQHATGEWIGFMNAGDSYVSPTVLHEVFHSVPAGTDIIYGDYEARYDRFSTDVRASTPDAFWKGMPFCHQSMFVKTALLREYPFNLRWKIAADYDFAYEQYCRNKVFWHFRKNIAGFRHDGASSMQLPAMYSELWKIACAKNHSPCVCIFHGSRYLMVLAAVFVRKMSVMLFEWSMYLRHCFQNAIRSRMSPLRHGAPRSSSGRGSGRT